MRIKLGEFLVNLKKKILLTGAVITVGAVSLTGCTKGDVKTENDSDIFTYEYVTTEDNNATESVVVQDNIATTNSVEIENDTQTVVIGDSYNKYLYDMPVNNNGFGVVTADSVQGLSSSKHNDNADRRLEYGSYVALDVDVTDEAYDTFATYIDNKDVVYIYAEYYGVDDALDRTAADLEHTEHTTIICDINTIPSYDLLFNTIKANNEVYMAKYPETYSLGDEELSLFVNLLLDSLNENYDYLSDIDKERVYCSLGNLKFLGIDSANPTSNPLGYTFNGLYTADGVVFADTNQIANIADPQAKEKVYVHEIQHIYQRTCFDQYNENIVQIGPSVIWYEEAQNPLFWNWSYEACAEMKTMSLLDYDDPMVYDTYIGYMKPLNLIALVNSDYDEETIANAFMSTDTESLYKIFGAETLEEKKEIINMMYSIDFIQNDREDFVDAYKDATGIDVTYDYLKTKYDMKADLCTTMSKYFYRNLAERVKNAEVPLQDVFYLINVFEADMNVHVLYDEEYSQDIIDSNKKFFTDYIEIQDQFFELLASDTDYTREELIDLFNTFALVRVDKSSNYVRNAEFTWLNDSEKEYIYWMLTSNLSSFSQNIRVVYNEDVAKLQMRY